MMSEAGENARLKPRNFRTHLQTEPSLSFSSSSEPCRLTVREVALDTAGLFSVEPAFEFAFEDAVDSTRERAFRDTVLPLSRAWRRRSCIFREKIRGMRISKEVEYWVHDSEL